MENMHIGVMSPNMLFDLADENRLSRNEDQTWRFDSVAKRASLLFEKLYLTENLEMTRDIVSHVDEDSSKRLTLQYLERRGLIFTPEDAGFKSGTDFLSANLRGTAGKFQTQLLKIGNPSNNCGPGEYTYVGQPDIGDFESHDGTHPRSEKGRNDPNIAILKEKYETLVLQRNAAVLAEAGFDNVAIVGRLRGPKKAAAHAHPAWNVVIKEMPDFDTRASWQDVLDFKTEDRTQHLIRDIRRWLRKAVAEDWTATELEDEIRELVYQYELHLRASGVLLGTSTLTCLITGLADAGESLIKLRLKRLSDLVAATVDRTERFRRVEISAPGHELALLSELKKPI
jgi:hypothetical protein